MKANFGDGSDGDVDLDGSSDPDWADPVPDPPGGSGTVYTLNRDIFCDNLTISNGCTLKPAGFRIFVRTLFTIDSGCAIRDDGNNAVGPAAGAGLPAGGAARYAGSGGGGNGGPGYGGSSGIGAPSAGYSGLPPGMTTYNGGNGGTSGGGGGTGGFGGHPYQLVDIPMPRSAAWYDQCILVGGSGSGYASGRLAQGSGGGGGGAASGGTGGGGGGGGGGIMISAWEIDNQGTISARGGDGDDGNAGVAMAAAGGGGGGSGGYVAILYNTVTGSDFGDIFTDGGDFGVAGTSGGSDGQAGDAGPILKLQEST